MAKPFTTLKNRMTPESRARAERKAKTLVHEIRLLELREALNKTQTDIASAMGVTQSAISQLERGGQDVMLSTLARYLEAIGAELKISARFQDEEVTLYDPSHSD